MHKRLGTALRSYKNKRWGAVLSDGKGTGGKGRLTDPIIDRMQTAYVYATRNNKNDQASSIAAIWAIYHHMIMGPPEESVASQHSYCPMMIKLDVSTTKIKYSTQKHMMDQNVYHLCFVASFIKFLHDCHHQIS